MFLLVPAYPGCPGSKAVKRSLLLLLLLAAVAQRDWLQRVGSRLAAAAGGALIFSGGRFWPQAQPPLSAVSDNCGCDAGSSCKGRHKLSADIAHPRHAQQKQRHVITLRYEASAEREARDTRTDLAAEPLV